MEYGRDVRILNLKACKISPNQW